MAVSDKFYMSNVIGSFGMISATPCATTLDALRTVFGWFLKYRSPAAMFVVMVFCCLHEAILMNPAASDP